MNIFIIIADVKLYARYKIKQITKPHKLNDYIILLLLKFFENRKYEFIEVWEKPKHFNSFGD